MPYPSAVRAAGDRDGDRWDVDGDADVWDDEWDVDEDTEHDEDGGADGRSAVDVTGWATSDRGRSEPTGDVVVTVERLVAGGAGLAREESGRVVLVAGALPGERVRATVGRERRDLVQASLAEVLDASPDRLRPPCGFVRAGCGGCDLQHAAIAAQPELKRAIVVDALHRLGRLTDPDVRLGPALPATEYRTTLRCVVADGVPGFRHRRSHRTVTVDDCLVAHPRLAELLGEGVFDGCREVTLRVGANTGDRLVLADPHARGVRVPGDVVLVGVDELRRGRHAHHHEEIAGRRWRISARSFFQPSAAGADAIVAEVVRAATAAGAEPLHAGDVVVDLYGGVGLLGGSLVSAAAADDVGLVLVERGRSSVADARHNLADLRPRVRAMAVEKWRPEPATVVIADPSRTGLGREAADRVAATGGRRVVLVSCDAASLGRDTRLLVERGYRHGGSVLVDQFAMTSHVEVVTRFDLPG